MPAWWRASSPGCGGRTDELFDLPEGYDRHAAALAIVDPGASNPSGVALAIHQACTQVIGEGGNQSEDAAVRLMTTQLAFLVQGDSDLDFDEYRQLMDDCRARAAQRRNARN